MFNSNLETKIGEEFVENGFVIRQVANQDAFDRINDIFFHLIQKKIGFKRMFLHASELGFVHPLTEKDLFLSAPLPKEFIELQEYAKKH